MCISRSVVSDSLQPHGLQPARFLCPWNSLGKNTGVGNHSLLQGNLPNPGIEPGSLPLQADSLPSERPGKPLYAEASPLSLPLSVSLLSKVRREKRVWTVQKVVLSNTCAVFPWRGGGCLLHGDVGCAIHFDFGAILHLSPWAKVSLEPPPLVPSLDSPCF